jgi:hypothetical protein
MVKLWIKEDIEPKMRFYYDPILGLQYTFE